MHLRPPTMFIGKLTLLCCFLLVSCQKQVTTTTEPAWQPPSEATLQAQYKAAVKDASDPAAPDDIYRRLWNVSDSNENLKWKSIAGEVHVKVATWTSWDGYDDNVGKQMTLAREIWVTLAPQMQEFCSGYNGPLDLDLRLRQLLGLPPDDQKTKVIEIWARPEDLFRPCADPGIADFECQGKFTQSTFLTLSEDYISWFDNQVSISYGEDNGYPWTRLGYTYDWNNDTPKFGLSEYIVREKSIVWVESSDKTAQYCGKDAN